jgi:hypothetical protein
VSYIVLRGRWCNIVLNEHAPSEEKSDDWKGSFYGELEQVIDNTLKYHMKILLGYLNAKVGREDILKPTIGNGSVHQDNNDNGVRIVNFATSKNLVVKCKMCPHRNIPKYTWTSPDGKNYNQIVHILIDRSWLSSILDLRSFSGPNCDNDQYLVVAKVREILEVNKQTAQKFEGKRFNMRKLKELEVGKQYQIEITNRFAALEDLK